MTHHAESEPLGVGQRPHQPLVPRSGRGHDGEPRRPSIRDQRGRTNYTNQKESETAACDRKNSGREGSAGRRVPERAEGNEMAAALGARRGALDRRAWEAALETADDVAGEAAIAIAVAASG
jgi:hypothetical protein